MQTFMQEKLLPAIMKFVNTKAISALKDGLIYTMPLTIVGSVFLLLANFPIQAVVDWIDSAGLMGPLDQAYGATFNIVALVGVIGIAYKYVKNEGHEGLSAGILGAVSLIILMAPTATNEDGAIVGNVIDKSWTAGQGMITAIIVGLAVGYIYSWFLNRNIRIKLPGGVPEGVSNAFTALIPSAVIITLMTFVYGFFNIVMNTTFIEVIYDAIQAPLQGLTDSLGGVIVAVFLVPFLWWFGIHGATVVNGILSPLWQANAIANQAIVDSGLELTVANGGRIVTNQFIDQFTTITGSGLTLGLVVYLMFFAKSEQSKQLGRLGGIPGVFNINEPILFGTPIVMNPFLAIPFMLMPVLSGVLLYLSISIGIMPLFTAVSVPWTTPPIISGFIVAGWRGALFQIFVLTLSFFVYLPFIRKIDKLNYENEQAAKNN